MNRELYIQDWTEVRSKVWINPYHGMVKQVSDRVSNRVYIQCTEELYNPTCNMIWPRTGFIVWNELNE